jgi:hypothetical protein
MKIIEKVNYCALKLRCMCRLVTIYGNSHFGENGLLFLLKFDFVSFNQIDLMKL